MRQFDLHIKSLNTRGFGVGHDSEDKVYWVMGAYPGEKIRVAVEKDTVSGKHTEAKLLQILKPSKMRIESSCIYFGECGGCDWLTLNYDSQKEAKQNAVLSALKRVPWNVQQVLPIIGADVTSNYRTRVQVRRSLGKMGFFKRRTHDVVDVETCMMMHPKIQKAYRELRSREHGPSADLQKWELTLSEDGTLCSAENEAHASQGFTQIHEQQNVKLKKIVSDWMAESGGKKVLECFAGNGNLTQSYCACVESVLALEDNALAVQKAKAWIEKNSKSHVRFEALRVDKKTAVFVNQLGYSGYDTLLLDPARSGTSGALSSLLHQQLKNIIYVSCSLDSFLTDIQCLKGAFSFRRIQVIDMFPQTHHIELVAWFSRYDE